MIGPIAPKACIFDLDGTLVDSLRDIAEALNECLELLGVPGYPMDRYRYMVGEGVPKLCERALGQTHPHLVKRLAELARPRYWVRPLRYTRPFPGVTELIGRLRAAHVKTAILSNKPHDMVLRMVRTFWPDGEFDSVYGYLEEELRKPHPHYVLRICAELGVQPAEVWMIGDTPTDIEAALRSGVLPVGVTWGFRPRCDLEAAGAAHIVDRPDQIA
ncbi:MAG: HAD family hydrolase [Planctomycetes bacterium]|nr:HAD family hydrolase [Planctomycetota bacterium]